MRRSALARCLRTWGPRAGEELPAPPAGGRRCTCGPRGARAHLCTVGWRQIGLVPLAAGAGPADGQRGSTESCPSPPQRAHASPRRSGPHCPGAGERTGLGFAILHAAKGLRCQHWLRRMVWFKRPRFADAILVLCRGFVARTCACVMCSRGGPRSRLCVWLCPVPRGAGHHDAFAAACSHARSC